MKASHVDGQLKRLGSQNLYCQSGFCSYRAPGLQASEAVKKHVFASQFADLLTAASVYRCKTRGFGLFSAIVWVLLLSKVIALRRGSEP